MGMHEKYLGQSSCNSACAEDLLAVTLQFDQVYACTSIERLYVLFIPPHRQRAAEANKL